MILLYICSECIDVEDILFILVIEICDVNVWNKLGRIVFYLVVKYGNIENLKRFFDVGCNRIIKDKFGFIVVGLVFKFNYKGSVEILLYYKLKKN